MSREIELHRVDIWNRATIADGKKLQATTIRPLSANDVILAEAISGYKKELQDYYDDEYTKLTTVIAPDIAKWNGTVMNLYMNSGNWCRTYDAVQNSGDKWNAAYESLKSSAWSWNNVGGSASSGAAASAWLSVNELPNDDAIDDFNCLRPTAETDGQYLITDGSMGKSDWLISPWSAWAPTEDGPQFQKPHKSVTGDRTLAHLAWDVQAAAHGGTNSIFFSNRTSAISAANTTLTMNGYGNLTQTLTTNNNAYYPNGFTHRDTTDSVLFIKGGSDSFTRSLVFTPRTCIDLENTFARGYLHQKQTNSITFSYGRDYGYGGSCAQCEGTEIYDTHNSITNMKGKNIEGFGGLHNTLTIKGNVWGIKGDAAAATYSHNMWALRIDNSLTNNCESYAHLPLSAVKNSKVESYWRSYSVLDGKPEYDGADGFSAKSVNSNVLIDNASPFGQYNEQIIDNSHYYLTKLNGHSLQLKNSFMFMDTSTVSNAAGYTPAVRVNNSYQCFKIATFADSNSQHESNFINFENMYLNGNYNKNLILSYSATSTNIFNSLNNNIICGIYNSNMGNQPIYLDNNIVLYAKNGGWTERGYADSRNNILELHNQSVSQYNRFNNSYVRVNTLPNSVTKTSPYTNFYNSFVVQNNVSAFEMVGNVGSPNGKAGAAFILTQSTKQTTGYDTVSYPSFIKTSNSEVSPYYQNKVIIGDGINFANGYATNTPTVLMFGKNIKAVGRTGIQKYSIFGSNHDVFFGNGMPGSVFFGGNYDLNKNERMIKFKASFPASWTGEMDDSKMFVLSDDVGPYFIVWGILPISSDGSNPEGYNGMYFYKDGSWYDVKSKTKLKTSE